MVVSLFSASALCGGDGGGGGLRKNRTLSLMEGTAAAAATVVAEEWAGVNCGAATFPEKVLYFA